MSLDKPGEIGYYTKRMVQDSGFRKKLRQRVTRGERGDKLLYSLWTRCRLEKGKEERSNFKIEGPTRECL